MSFIKRTCDLLYRTSQKTPQVQHVRHKFTDWRMLKDFQKRQEVGKHGKVRLRINALRKNSVLPPELQAIADKEIADMPKRSCPNQMRHRCSVTSRPRGVVHDFRVSRIVFRHLADYNQLAGVQRAKW